MSKLRADVAARLLAAAGDVALVLDGEGVIRDIAIGNPDLAKEGAGDWVDRNWADTVTRESRKKVTEMLRDARGPGPKRWRQVNHETSAGEAPIRYMALDAGEAGIIAIGRDLRTTAELQQRLLQAQQAMERDHIRLRQAESRYRQLFEQSAEAVLIVDAGTRRIVEANPAAEALAGKARGALNGQAFATLIDSRDREAAIALLGAVSASDRALPIEVRLANGAASQLAASLYRQGRHALFLVRALPTDDAPASAPSEVLDRIPDAFVLTDEAMVVVAHNAAFLELTEFARSEDVVGQPLGRFLGRPGIDAGLIATQLKEHGGLRNMMTIVRGRYESQSDVEVSAVAAPGAAGIHFGFSIRAVSRQREPQLVAIDAPRSVEQLTDLVGRMSLKDIVRESTDLIERLCIEAALVHTSDNRASAAEILGLSRQSLYSKLHRHGLVNAGSDEGE